jgi:autotransporter-associated beta strand protein
MISNLKNTSTGALSGTTVGIANSGTITTLTNAQGGNSSTAANTALTYSGALPTNYNVLVSSSTHYGQVTFSNVSGTLTFGVDSSSQLSSGTYFGILSGISPSYISNPTATDVLGAYSWELIEGSSQYWNLVVAKNVSSGTTTNSSDLGNSGKPVIAGGTLLIDQSATISSNLTLSAASTNTIDANGKTAIISGVISNQGSSAGTLTIADSGGGGGVTLTGSNTYTGPTTVSSGGTLKLEGSGSIASSSGLTLNGTLDISGINSSASLQSVSGTGTLSLGSKTLTLTNAAGTFSGVITGSGSVAVGGGNLVLSGTNTFSGGVTVSAGATITAASSLALGTGTLSLIGSVGTSAIILMKDGVILANNIYVEADPDFTADTGATTTIAGVISGTGDVNIKGSGTVKFTNTNTYTGPLSSFLAPP